MLEAIVWDFDGVIVDSEPLHYRAFLRVAETIGYSFTWEEYLDKFIGFDDRDAFRAMLGDPQGGGPDEDRPRLIALCEQKADAFEAVVNESVKPIPGTLEFINETAGSIRFAIASGATRRDIDLILGKLNLVGRFETIVSADDVAQSKPDPQSYALAVQRLGVLPGKSLAIEDTAAGVASARGAGLWTLGLSTSGPAEILQQAHRVIPNLKDITLEQLREWFED